MLAIFRLGQPITVLGNPLLLRLEEVLCIVQAANTLRNPGVYVTATHAVLAFLTQRTLTHP